MTYDVKKTQRLAATLALSALPVTLAAGPASAAGTYDPQGARWSKTGEATRYDYCAAGDEETVPRERAVAEWQRLLNTHGASLPVDGDMGPEDEDAVREFQRANFLPHTGCVNAVTARYLLTGTIKAAAARQGVPAELLHGVAWAESVDDAGAVGPGGADLGLFQMVPEYWPRLTENEIWSVSFSANATADRLERYHRRIGDWRVTVVSHNSPARAFLYRSPRPTDPVKAAEWDKARVYSERVLSAPGLPDFVNPIPDAAPAPAPDNAVRHTVRAGETLWRIAVNYYGGGTNERAGHRWVEIAEANGGTKNIRAGQVLIIP